MECVSEAVMNGEKHRRGGSHLESLSPIHQSHFKTRKKKCVRRVQSLEVKLSATLSGMAPGLNCDKTPPTSNHAPSERALFALVLTPQVVFFYLESCVVFVLQLTSVLIASNDVSGWRETWRLSEAEDTRDCRSSELVSVSIFFFSNAQNNKNNNTPKGA